MNNFNATTISLSHVYSVCFTLRFVRQSNSATLAIDTLEHCTFPWMEIPPQRVTPYHLLTQRAPILISWHVWSHFMFALVWEVRATATKYHHWMANLSKANNQTDRKTVCH